MKYSNEKTIETKKKDGDVRKVCQVALYCNNKYFDIDMPYEDQEKIHKIVRDVYWKNARKFLLKGHKYAVKISGLHFRISEVDDLRSYDDYKKFYMILQSFYWPHKNSYTKDDYAFFICDKKIFKLLFDRFWFALLSEVHFELFVIRPENITDCLEWGENYDCVRSTHGLEKYAVLHLDNQHNGFHVKFTVPEEFSDLLETAW